MVFGVFDPLFWVRKSIITWGEEHKGVFGLSGSQLELRCVTPHSHRSGQNVIHLEAKEEVARFDVGGDVFWGLGCGRGGPPRAHLLVTPVGKSRLFADSNGEFRRISEFETQKSLYCTQFQFCSR